MVVVVKIKIKNLDQIKQRFKTAPFRMTQELDKGVNRIVTKLDSSAKHNAPVNKQSGGGNLRQSIHGKMTGIAKGRVRVGVKYAGYVHEGTRPHTIRVRQKRVLANKRTGQVFGKVVQHPGTRANPFLQKAIDDNQRFIDKEFENAVTRTFK